MTPERRKKIDDKLIKQATLDCIYYEDGKKFQSTRPFLVQTRCMGYDIVTDFCRLFPDGRLIGFPKWCWDGASGAFDTKRTIRSSASHDILYKLIRLGFLPPSERANADLTLKDIMILDKAHVSRAWAWLKALKWWGSKNAHYDNRKKELKAP